MLLEGRILLGLFYPINLIIVYLLDENKPQFLATFEYWGWEVADQVLIFLTVFEPEPFATCCLLKEIVS